MRDKVEKVINNFWVRVIFMTSTIFGIFKTYGDAIMNYLIVNSSWLLGATITSLICGSFLACYHAYLNSKKNKKDLIILTARLDGQFKKIDSQFEAVGESIKVLSKSITDIVDLVEKNRKYMEERFKQLYEEINKKQDKHP